ncbi:MAG: aspartate aminotransferase family protein [Eubacteriales bacterium]|nr:aspartate aminotransferase family protein [Eubacteriales bacterium]
MTNDMLSMIEQAEKDLLHTYNRYQIVLDRGEGVYLYDVNGKKYLDFMSGIGVFALGYGNRHYNEALTAQLGRVVHTSNYFYNEPAIRAAHRLKEVSGMDRVFFTNSGAEAVEGALKAALKYAYLKDGRSDHQVVALEHSFHGRTFGALSVTGNPHYREAYGVMPCGAQFAKMNDLESIRQAITDKTCAVIMEVVQGEGGIIPADANFLKNVRALCDQKDILLIFDEVQCGMGRTGSMFAWQQYGVKPDIMASAKALGCGVPVGAFLMTEKVGENSLKAGDHGTTYGGNPLACAAVNAVLDEYASKSLVDHVNDLAPYLVSRLDELTAKHEMCVARRGRGLMQGILFDRPVSGIIAKAMEKGLIMINAGANVLRFLPPLVIEKEHVDEMIAILEEAIAECEA